MNRAKTKMERLYARYDYLALSYAKKLEINDSSMEFEDVVQEFRMKLWSSLQTYLRKWKDWKNQKEGNKMFKPMPLKMYLKSALSNRSKDMFREMNLMNPRDFQMEREVERKKSEGLIDISEDVYSYSTVKLDYSEYWREKINTGDSLESFDVGQDDLSLNIDVNKKKITVNSTDLMSGMLPIEKKFFMMYIQGIDAEQIDKRYKGVWNPTMCLNSAAVKVREMVSQMTEEIRTFEVLNYQED